jgi:flagellar biosynthetic protein FliQ
VETLGEVVREALILAAVLCLPVLAVATAVGTVVAVLQAATQIQEQTLSLLPKLLAVGLMVALFGGFALGRCGSLLERTVRLLPQIVRTA